MHSTKILIKTYISNPACMTRFWNNHHHYRSKWREKTTSCFVAYIYLSCKTISLVFQSIILDRLGK